MRLLVVEDEYWIRKGILEAVDWRTLRMEPAGEARTGAEALALLDQQPIDVMITDMKMPVMGGDALLAELMRRGYRGGLIVLSEYSDYAYMRQAIHAQVDEYMLKPIDEKELNAALLRIRNRLLTQASQTEPLARLLAALAAGEPPPATNAGGEPVTLACVWAERLRVIPFGREDVAGGTLYWHWLDQHEGLLLCTGEVRGGTPPAAWEEARARWQAAGAGALWLAVSGRVNPERAETALAQAREAARFWRCGAGVVAYAHIPRCEKPDPETLLPPKALTLLLEHGQPAEAGPVAEKLLAPWAHGEWVYLPALRNTLLECALLLDRACRELGAEGPAIPTQAIQAVHCPGDAQACLAELLGQALSAVAATRFASGEDVVEQMIAHLRAHFAEDVNLLGLAEQYHMNYIYVSRLFKKRTGVNFTDYLLRLRMEEARRLLAQGALRVKDVATMVGYPNPYYFSTSYQRYFGHSPTEEPRGSA